ncbi:hypothetical protein [Rhizobium grahamii]|uniref:Uncharacterized protein n=1 Tax=Rhizobium grahamii TaxID=1120045 RepID=A0A370KIV5_9HYPH|nr:hypothetical protein [Rhizobium grahamii]RDJ05819.1 hypothetical protein B5K06_25700 [Rhizobium grahamii]
MIKKSVFLVAIFSLVLSVGAAREKCRSGVYLSDGRCVGTVQKERTLRRDGKGSALPASPSISLLPVRAYIRTTDIPPPGFGAYGVVTFQSTATDANAAKLKMVCRAFVATFPKNHQIPDSVRLEDRMITLWPIFHVADPAVAADDCDFVTSDYDLGAAALAMRDARLQGAEFEGEGPYLVGWSPSDSRGRKDKLVLVVDMSAANDQIAIDRLFLFWKQKIIDDPDAWRGGFSLERLRVSIKDFADKYGQDMLDAIKLVSVK